MVVHELPPVSFDDSFTLLDVEFYYLSAGKKVLTVWVDEKKGEAGDNIVNRRRGRKTPLETTALYTKEFQMIQQAADRLGKEIVHTFQTSHPKLIAWAADPIRGGPLLAHHERVPNERLFLLRRTFHPTRS